MTLVVAGYKQNGYVWKKDLNQDYTPDRKSGIFIVADSMISTVTQGGRSPLVTGFQKIKEISINVWEPHFIGELFQGYIKVQQQHKCLIAFAGSTLTAQHIVDNISGHLSNLRIDYVEAYDFKCVIRKGCDSNNLIKNGVGTHYCEETFLPDQDYLNLLNAEYVSEVVEHSINKAIQSKKKYVLDPNALNAMRTDIVLAINCPHTRQDYIYKYSFNDNNDENGRIHVFCEKELVEANGIAVIGMVNSYGEQALEIAHNGMNNELNFREKMTDFVVKCVKEDSTFEIGMPVVVKTLDGVSVKKTFIPDDT